MARRSMIVLLPAAPDWIIKADGGVLQWLHSHNTPFGIKLLGTITLLGSPAIIAVLGAAVAFWLISKRLWIVLAGWCAALVGGGTIERILKVSIQRPRPEFAAQFLYSFSYSFPSGHAINSVVAYGMLAYIVLTSWNHNYAARAGVIVAAAMLVLTIGFSRLYLGVHYLTDVVGGFAAGSVWLTLCIAFVESAKRSRTSPPSRKGDPAAKA